MPGDLCFESPTSTSNRYYKVYFSSKIDDGFQIALQILLVYQLHQTKYLLSLRCRPSLVSIIISAVIGKEGFALAKMPDFSSNRTYNVNFTSNITAPSCAEPILSVHIICRSLLKDAWRSSKPCFGDCYCNDSLDLHCCSCFGILKISSSLLTPAVT